MKMPKISILNMGLEIFNLIKQLHHPGVIELINVFGLTTASVAGEVPLNS